jgi:hypothetical protein
VERSATRGIRSANVPAPAGAEECVGHRQQDRTLPSPLPSPLRGDEITTMLSTGCAASPLHPWLHSGAPLGRCVQPSRTIAQGSPASPDGLPSCGRFIRVAGNSPPSGENVKQSRKGFPRRGTISPVAGESPPSGHDVKQSRNDFPHRVRFLPHPGTISDNRARLSRVREWFQTIAQGFAASGDDLKQSRKASPLRFSAQFRNLA